MEGRSTAKGPEVCGAGKATSDQGEAGRTRNPGGAVRMTVRGGADCEVRGGVTGTAAQSEARGSTHQGRAGPQQI